MIYPAQHSIVKDPLQFPAKTISDFRMRIWELKTLIPIPQSQIRNQCGGERARTADLLLAKQALSQAELHPRNF